MLKLIPCVIALFVGLPCVAGAAFEHIAHVFQPNEVEGPGPMVSIVTYVGYNIDWRDPASTILLTTEPNSILCDGKPQNRNAAAEAGIRFADETVRPEAAERGVGRWNADTLHIRVDLSSLVIPPDSPSGHNVYRESYKELVSTTLWCGLRNARMDWPRVRYVDYRLVGPDVFSPYAGVYSLAEVESIAPPLETLSISLRPRGRR